MFTKLIEEFHVGSRFYFIKINKMLMYFDKKWIFITLFSPPNFRKTFSVYLAAISQNSTKQYVYTLWNNRLSFFILSFYMTESKDSDTSKLLCSKDFLETWIPEKSYRSWAYTYLAASAIRRSAWLTAIQGHCEKHRTTFESETRSFPEQLADKSLTDPV